MEFGWIPTLSEFVWDRSAVDGLLDMKPGVLAEDWLRSRARAIGPGNRAAPRSRGANGSQMGSAVVPTGSQFGWARPLGATGMSMAGEKPKAPVDVKAGAHKRRAETTLNAGFDRFIERELTRMYGHIVSEPLPEDIQRLLGQVPSGRKPDGEGERS